MQGKTLPGNARANFLNNSRSTIDQFNQNPPISAVCHLAPAIGVKKFYYYGKCTHFTFYCFNQRKRYHYHSIIIHTNLKKLIIITFLLPGLAAFAQDPPKQTPAIRTSLAIKIDGVIDEAAWKQAPLITGLVEMRPTPGRAEDEKNKTEVYLLYDDNAVYFGGRLYEHDKDSISTQLSGRDGIGVNDFIGVVFDTYQDKINGLGFYVTPLNEQFDIKYTIGMSNNGEDISWNAVYSTATRMTENGWSFEMRIPYSALRFSKVKLQNWNMHIIRRRAKSGKQFSGNPIDPTKFGFMNQSGVWKGLQDLKPPVRLSFSPYFSIY